MCCFHKYEDSPHRPSMYPWRRLLTSLVHITTVHHGKPLTLMGTVSRVPPPHSHSMRASRLAHLPRGGGLLLYPDGISAESFAGLEVKLRTVVTSLFTNISVVQRNSLKDLERQHFRCAVAFSMYNCNIIQIKRRLLFFLRPVL